ncbi:peptidyl-tRNA hydrolase, putative [Candida dubliniensis CD36]|uniref:Peptidyl-tRNA hydrolase, putative n=1 Tax=Candida dubliniensis (strain CD36 / ATCC MYA-646 / CBS 7987 / NCPF 3949 / NRRL Y-17841) TaxID=573826 RepID=B9WAN2_CANDC|nr:peptidyl-tRNA hydrolase, putative [Candida dubliniensis CD36]CAX43452.1 peptidyl-tRNA hydrolase, putative [Candida dubliniensis CD36]
MSYSHPPIIFFSIGNPGPITRHSVGHFMLKRLMEFSNSSIKQLHNYSLYSLSIDSLNNIIYIKSNTYMNESSKAWNKFKSSKEYKSFLKQQVVTVIVLYDDFENNLGTIKLKQFKKNKSNKNNNESHNGLKDLKFAMIDNNFNDETIYLLGIGIGPKPSSNPNGEIMKQWILSPFNKQSEKIKLELESFKLLQLYIDSMIQQISNDNDNDNDNNGMIKDINKFNAKMTKLWKRKQELEISQT